MSRTHLVSLAFLASLVTACTAIADASPFDAKKASCDLRPKDDQCTDIRNYKGPSLITFQGVCTTLTQAKPGATGYKEDAQCGDVGNMWGGCQSDSGGALQTNWYYKGDKYKTVDDAKKECDSGQSWVNPS